MNRMSLLIVLSVVLCASIAPAADKPNIIYIVADDLGYADIGAQQLSKDVKTPNIDSIATKGVRFTSGYVSCPVCSPTRAGLMTGRYQQRFGHEFNPGPNESEQFGLPLDQVTLAQSLKNAGYATGMVGKWHLGFQPAMHPTKRGFDEFFGFLAGAHAYNKVGEGKNVLMRGTTPLESTDYLTDAFGREAAGFVERSIKSDKPFFLYLAFNAIHTPQEAPQKYLERFPDVKDDKRKRALAMLSATDEAVGLVLDQIKQNKLEEKTLIVFHTDNGGPTNGNGSINTPLRGFKGDTWEGGIRVPFAMQWTGKLPAGKVYDKPVIALDVFPTACAAAGAELPKDVKLDGVDLTPFLTGQSDGSPHEALYWRFGNQWAVRSGNFKLVKPRGQQSPQLFDLASDISEKTDIAGANVDTAKELQAKYDAWNATLVKPLWRDSRDQRQGAGGGGARRARQARPATQPAN